MVYTFSRGNLAYLDDETDTWIWYDGTTSEDELERECYHCGKMAGPHGEDACLGWIPFAQNACCGHHAVYPLPVQGRVKVHPYIQLFDGSTFYDEEMWQLMESYYLSRMAH
jgi:hypothetical protein